MSEEQLKAFWEAVQADTSLQEKLRAATDADSIASIAKEAGFEITADEVKEAQGELSEEQLKGVAGGLCCACKCWMREVRDRRMFTGFDCEVRPIKNQKNMTDIGPVDK